MKEKLAEKLNTGGVLLDKELKLSKDYRLYLAEIAIQFFKEIIPEAETGQIGNAYGSIPGMSEGWNSYRESLLKILE